MATFISEYSDSALMPVAVFTDVTLGKRPKRARGRTGGRRLSVRAARLAAAVDLPFVDALPRLRVLIALSGALTTRLETPCRHGEIHVVVGRSAIGNVGACWNSKIQPVFYCFQLHTSVRLRAQSDR